MLLLSEAVVTCRLRTGLTKPARPYRGGVKTNAVLYAEGRSGSSGQSQQQECSSNKANKAIHLYGVLLSTCFLWIIIIVVVDVWVAVIAAAIAFLDEKNVGP
jgi:hypothetical protein